MFIQFLKSSVLFILLSAFSIIKQPLVAQDFDEKIIKSNVFNVTSFDKSSTIKIIGADNIKNIYVLHIPLSKNKPDKCPYYISKFDEELNQIYKLAVDLSSGKDYMNLHDVMLVNGEFICLQSLDNLKARSVKVFLRKLDINNIKPISELIPLGEHRIGKKRKSISSTMYFSTTKDTSNIMINCIVRASSFKTFHSSISETLTRVIVMDRELNIKWKKNYPPYLSLFKSICDQEINIDESGKVFYLEPDFRKTSSIVEFLLKEDVGRLKQQDYSILMPHYDFSINLITKSDETEESETIEIEGIDIRNLNFKPKNANELYVFGVYSEKGFKSVEGFFFGIFDFKTSKITKLTLGQMSDEFYDQKLSDDFLNQFKLQTDENEWNPFEYKLSELFFQKDGTPYFLIEEIFQGSLFLDGSIYDFYSTSDIELVRIIDLDKDDVEFVNIPRKENISSYGDRKINSITSFENNGEFYIIYSDRSDSQNLSYREPNLFTTYVVKIRHDGELETIKILEDSRRMLLHDQIYRQEGGIIFPMLDKYKTGSYSIYRMNVD